MDSTSKDSAGGTRRRTHARARGLRRWLARAQGLGQGLTVPEMVFELQVRRGLPLPEVAKVLGVSLEEVRKHRSRRRGARAVGAPQSKADLTALREQVGVELWETVAATFFAGKLGAEDGQAAPPRPAVMAVRIKALKQIGKLYGVGRKKRGGDGVRPDCATPEEIVEMVRERRRGES